MIFLPSHRLPLNGSKFLGVILIVLIGWGCGASKKAVDPHKDPNVGTTAPTFDKYNPKTGKIEKSTAGTADIDTVEWEVVDEETFPPIKNPEKIDESTLTPSLESQFLDRYRISFLLPFLNNSFDRINGLPDDKAMIAFHYYYGAKMALNRLGGEGLNLEVDVFDTEASGAVTQSLLNGNAVTNSNLIIGPAKKENVAIAAEYCKANGITMFSPFNASPRMGQDNPFYVQIRPTLETHCKKITEHVLSQYRSDQVVLVVRDKGVEKNRLGIFQKYFPTNGEGVDSLGRFKEMILPGNLKDLAEFDLMPAIKQDETTVFIVPSWSNESFIYSFLRQLRVAKGLNNVVVYGMPQWKNYERISYDYYEALNVHVSIEYFVDREDQQVRAFKKNFFETYGLIPNEYAYKGYDQMMYLGRMLKNNGTFWQNNQGINFADLTKSDFRIAPVVKLEENGLYPMDRFENQSVTILKFENYRFRKAE